MPAAATSERDEPTPRISNSASASTRTIASAISTAKGSHGIALRAARGSSGGTPGGCAAPAAWSTVGTPGGTAFGGAALTSPAFTRVSRLSA